MRAYLGDIVALGWNNEDEYCLEGSAFRVDTAAILTKPDDSDAHSTGKKALFISVEIKCQNQRGWVPVGPRRDTMKYNSQK